MVDRAKTVHISARCTPDQKERYELAQERLGFRNLSELLLDSLDCLSDAVHEDGWECRLIHLEGDRIVAMGDVLDAGMLSPTTAFPIVAPASFWRRVERLLR